VAMGSGFTNNPLQVSNFASPPSSLIDPSNRRRFPN